jgi:hypothetical protein
MKKEYMKPEAEKVEFNYTENVTASWNNTIQDNGHTWTYTNIDNDANGTYHNCASSFKEMEGMVCGYNGKHTSNPNHTCV